MLNTEEYEAAEREEEISDQLKRAIGAVFIERHGTTAEAALHARFEMLDGDFSDWRAEVLAQIKELRDTAIPELRDRQFQLVLGMVAAVALQVLFVVVRSLGPGLGG